VVGDVVGLNSLDHLHAVDFSGVGLILFDRVLDLELSFNFQVFECLVDLNDKVGVVLEESTLPALVLDDIVERGFIFEVDRRQNFPNQLQDHLLLDVVQKIG